MGLWKYKLESDVAVTVSAPDITGAYAYRRGTYEHKWFNLHFGIDFIVITVKKNYAWDGCTPKFKMGGKIFGVWDGFFNHNTKQPDTYYASLVHDVLLQFIGEHPISRKHCDEIFLWIMQRDAFPFAWVYYAFVRLWFLVVRRSLSKLAQWRQKWQVTLNTLRKR